MRTSVQIIKFIYVLKDRISFSRRRRYNGHVILADSSPILFRPISNTEVRCLVDVPGQKVPSIANREIVNYLKTIVAPQTHLTRDTCSGVGMIVALSDIVLLRDHCRPLSNLNDAPTLCNYLECFYTLRKGASGIIFPIIKSEGVR
ncbi:putative squalene monooxygenase [Helianthus anomalus]